MQGFMPGAPEEVMKFAQKLGVFVLSRTHITSLYGLPV